MKITSKLVPLPIDNVDTDQIIPARFLKATTKEGFGDLLFHDWRQNPEFVLNQPFAKDRQILIAGDNFGCGSSREHAPWALTQFGFRAVISTSFADIFKGNALKNGLLPVVVPADVHAELLRNPDGQVSIGLAEQTLKLESGRSVEFPIDAFAKHCLLNGVDELGYILQQEAAIAAFEGSRVGSIDTRA
jgi:3-isopropylmalate/(R)-2-methylmalate dehydratase small subunit